MLERRCIIFVLLLHRTSGRTAHIHSTQDTHTDRITYIASILCIFVSMEEYGCHVTFAQKISIKWGKTKQNKKSWKSVAQWVLPSAVYCRASRCTGRAHTAISTQFRRWTLDGRLKALKTDAFFLWLQLTILVLWSNMPLDQLLIYYDTPFQRTTENGSSYMVCHWYLQYRI